MYINIYFTYSFRRNASTLNKYQYLTTVVSLKFVAAISSWYSWVTTPHEFTYSTKTNCERGNYLCETENRRFHEITSPRISKKHTIHVNWPPRI